MFLILWGTFWVNTDNMPIQGLIDEKVQSKWCTLRMRGSDSSAVFFFFVVLDAKSVVLHNLA